MADGNEGQGAVWPILQKVGAAAWENKEWVTARVKEIVAWLWPKPAVAKNQPGVIVVGPGGVGKTTLGKVLSLQPDFLFDPSGYEESLNVEHYELQDEPGVEVVVLPGQKHRRDESWADLNADIANGKFRGAILLAAYGYHSLGYSYKNHPLYKGNKEEFLSAYLADRRREELAILNQLVPHLVSNRSKLWLMTLVGKQDLWWPERGRVDDHYRGGEYATALKGVADRLGQRSFRHELAMASLVIRNFTAETNEVLQPNVAGYDQWQQTASVRRLFQTLDSLREWEGQS